MSVNDTSRIVPALVIDLVLNIKVHNTNDSVGSQQRSKRVDDWMKFRNHRKTITHSQQPRANLLDSPLITIQSTATNTKHRLVTPTARLIITESKRARIFTNNSDIPPPESSKPQSRNLAQRRR